MSVKFPNLWVGLNMLAITGLEAFQVLPESLFSYVKGIWVDDASKFSSLLFSSLLFSSFHVNPLYFINLKFRHQ